MNNKMSIERIADRLDTLAEITPDRSKMVLERIADSLDALVEITSDRSKMSLERIADAVENYSGGGGSSDLFSQVATVIVSVPASENTGTFSDGAAEIAVIPFESTGNAPIFIDSVTIEVNGQTKTLNSYPIGGSVEGAAFDDGATIVTPSIVIVGDSPYIGFYIYDNTYSRTDSITVKYSAFNVYTPNDDIIAIYPTLSNSGE